MKEILEDPDNVEAIREMLFRPKRISRWKLLKRYIFPFGIHKSPNVEHSKSKVKTNSR
jgi:hypothetical protein